MESKHKSYVNPSSWDFLNQKATKKSKQQANLRNEDYLQTMQALMSQANAKFGGRPNKIGDT